MAVPLPLRVTKAACLINAPFVLLECVEQAASDSWVRDSIRAFQEFAGFSPCVPSVNDGGV